ncbi:MAG: twin-arginine translocation pathway signal protein [Pseudomonadota bacterium]
MSANRRSVLKILGVGTLTVAAGAAGFALTREPSEALRPWSEAGLGDDPRLNVLSFALLAPNPHNLQPWQVRLDGNDGFTLFADPHRKLPETDPYDRQITIGLGCFLELARQAAAEAGYRLDITPFPDGEPSPVLDGRPVASARLVASESTRADPLFGSVLTRRSCKEPYDIDRAVPAARLEQVRSAIASDAGLSTEAGITMHFAADEARVRTLRDLTMNAYEVEVYTRRTYMESIDLMRFGKAEINRNPDGIDIGGPMLDALNAFGILTRETLADEGSDAFKQGMDMYREMLLATPAYVWLATSGNTRRDQLGAGAAWIRMNLAATAEGLALHPVSQALQEYAEMNRLFAKVHKLLAKDGATRIQMLGRIGYGPAVAPSPRWPVRSRLLS